MLTPSNPEVLIHDPKGAELSHIIYLAELQLHVFLSDPLLNLVCLKINNDGSYFPASPQIIIQTLSSVRILLPFLICMEKSV